MKELMFIGMLLVVVASVMAALGFRGREQIVGIDLGTTFSVVALKSKGVVTVLPDRFTGKPLVPSVVHYFPNGTVIVGRRAMELRGTHELQTVFNAKRFIGRRMSEISEDAASHPFRVTANTSDRESEDPSSGFSIPLSDSESKWVSPIDVGAEIIRHLKQSINEYIGYPIKRAVICVPAKFGSKETAATVKAFEQAGIKVMRVLEEPTAAAIAYGLHKTDQVRNVLIYDIGGGTLDTSLLYMNGRSVSVLGVAGDDRLGGSDFDVRMRDLLMAKLATSKTVPSVAPSPPRCNMNGLHIVGEEAKIRLSSETSVEVSCLADDGTVRSIAVTRDDFEQAAADLFARTMMPIEKVLEDQMMTRDHVHDVVLVGGASRMPRLRAMLREYFGADKKLHTEIDPDVTVAYGAANIID